MAAGIISLSFLYLQGEPGQMQSPQLLPGQLVS